MCQDIKKTKYTAKIISNINIEQDIYEIILKQQSIACNAKAGQFINVYCKAESRLLPRPISICEVDEQNGTIKIVYAVVGKGTEEFSKFKKGDEVKVLGSLGNGFMIDKNVKQNIIIGGGVGVPPLLELVKRLKGENIVFLGFRTRPYLIEEFKKYADVYVATDDGSEGEKGTVIDILNKYNAKGQMIYSCGPKPMLKAVKNWAEEKNIKAQLSLEERMGCGFGACVGCVCKIKEEGKEDWVYKKVCKDGPIFWAKEVVFDE